MSTMKLWDYEWIGNHGYRRAVPGGWVVSENSLEGGVACCFVPDPAAPHCRPAPSPVGPPPMTDADLIAWLTATYGEPRPIGDLMWWDLDPDSSRAAWHNPGQPKETDCWGLVDAAGFTTLTCPAHIAGPALWDAQHFGGTP